jgi:hypothetical protein
MPAFKPREFDDLTEEEKEDLYEYAVRLFDLFYHSAHPVAGSNEAAYWLNSMFGIIQERP